MTRILVVDDEQSMREMLGIVMRKEGYQVVMADSRAQAAAVLHENKSVEFHAHFYLWKAYQEAGDLERARFEFHAAKYFLEFIDPHTPEPRDLRQQIDRKERRSRRGKGRHR